jgi:hypothetical protein
MPKKELRHGRFVAGAGGVLLIVSLFLPWAGAEGASQTGFELLTVGEVFLLIVGLVAIAAALTWGRFGLFRPDVSLNGATDLLGVVATILVAWLILFDFPSGAGREIGVYLALVAAIAIAGGAGDYSTLRGAPLFPRIDRDGKHRRGAQSGADVGR